MHLNGRAIYLYIIRYRVGYKWICFEKILTNWSMVSSSPGMSLYQNHQKIIGTSLKLLYSLIYVILAQIIGFPVLPKEYGYLENESHIQIKLNKVKLFT